MQKLLYYTLLTIFFASCKKPDCDPVYHDFEPEIAAFKFSTGSWWKYRDTLNGVEDSLYVSSIDYNSFGIHHECVSHSYPYDDIILEGTGHVNTHFTLSEHHSVVAFTANRNEMAGSMAYFHSHGDHENVNVMYQGNEIGAIQISQRNVMIPNIGVYKYSVADSLDTLNFILFDHHVEFYE